jgi:HEAT repeat protein
MGRRASWAVPQLVRVLANAKNEWHRAKACEALSAIGPPEARDAVPELLASIRHPSGNVRRYATKALYLAGATPSEALGPLREALTAEKDERVRDWMREALAHLEALAAGKERGEWRSK